MSQQSATDGQEGGADRDERAGAISKERPHDEEAHRRKKKNVSGEPWVHERVLPCLHNARVLLTVNPSHISVDAWYMLALSIRQPYAELILRGVKTIEYRSRPTRRIGERFYIYAAKSSRQPSAVSYQISNPEAGSCRGERPARRRSQLIGR